MTLFELPTQDIANRKARERVVKEEVTKRIHALADKLDWCHLNIPQKTKHYEEWAVDPELGGKIAAIMGQEKVHMFIKDTVMRAYRRSKRLPLEQLLKNMGIQHGSLIRSYEKPHALLYDHSHLYTLTVAKEWRMAMLSAYERAAQASEKVEQNRLFITDHRVDRFVDQSYRNLIEAAGKRLDVEVYWVM
ncbi:hypothetical protein ACTQ9L_15415 [Deinococcus wulumuqiensis]